MESYPKALKFWSKFTKFCHSLYITPYYWDSNLQCPQLNPRKRLRCLCVYIILTVIIIAYEIFLLYRVLQGLQNDAESFQKKTRLIFFIVVCLILNVDQWIILRNFTLYPTFLAGFSRQLREFNNAHSLDSGADKKLRIFHVSIVLACSTPAIARVLDVFRHPEGPALLTSLAANPQALSLPVKLIIGYIHLHMNAFLYMNRALNLMAVTYYYYGFVRMVRSLKLTNELHSWRLQAKTKKIARLHRELYILKGACSDIFSTYNLAMEMAGLVFTIVNLFLAVIFVSFKNLCVGLLVLVVVFIVFRSMADVYEESESARQSWRAVHLKWFTKFRRSAMPLAVTVGSFYFVDRQLLLTMLDIITNNTAGLVLTYRS